MSEMASADGDDAPATALDGALPAMDVAGRLGRLRDLFDEAGIDGLVVTNLTNIRYLTGFTGSAGLLFVLGGGTGASGVGTSKTGTSAAGNGVTVLLTDGRYATQSAEQLDAAGVDARTEIAAAPEQIGRAARLVGAAAPVRLGLEAADVSWARQRSFAADWFPGLELVATTGLVETLRRVKDAGELGRLDRAAAIADRALAQVRPMLEHRPREIDVGRALDHEMRRLGAEGPSFETIVASGPNSAKPHHRPADRRILPGEPVVIDFGAVYDGYCSDMTRTVWVGDVSDRDLRRAIRVVGESQAAGLAAVAAGVDAAAVDAACREVIGAAGWADRFVHGTGHGVGLDIHEAPSVAATSVDTLRTGHVVTVEPGVYLPGLGGVRIEDTVVVTDDGSRPLTTTPKDLL